MGEEDLFNALWKLDFMPGKKLTLFFVSLFTLALYGLRAPPEMKKHPMFFPLF